MTNKFKVIIIGSLGIVILSGCSNKYPVTFDSTPQGALLVCDGKNWGYTPQTLYIDREQLKGKSSLPVNCSANWVSGVIKNYPTSIPLDKYPNGASANAQRPIGDNYATDAQFALGVQNSNYQRRQAQAAEDSVYQQRRNANANRKQASELNNINNYIRYGY
jgi:hypothetical protein